MDVPFTYGKIAEGSAFTNRIREIRQLSDNFRSGINTIVISPRRWGKSSLVQKTAGQLSREKKMRFCFIDLYNVRSEEEFYRYFARKVLATGSTKLEDFTANVRRFLSRFIPRITFGPEDEAQISLELDWKEVVRQPEDILDLPEKISSEHDYRIIVCIDEFQNIAEFHEPLDFQKKLRSHWQKQQHVCYCLYGSKRHLLMEVFSNASMPLYKFGDILFLRKIERQDWIKFILQKFRSTAKSIDKTTAGLIAELVDYHPYYVQQLAMQSWLRTDTECTDEIVYRAHNSLIDQMDLLFQNHTDRLTRPQVNFLQTVIDRVAHPSARENLDKYRLGTSGNVNRIKEALIQKEVIDINGSTIEFQDPLYKCWLGKKYFL